MIADTLATQELRASQYTTLPTKTLPNTECMLRQGEYLYTSKEMEQLQVGWTQYWIQHYYCTRWKWTHKYH